MPSFQNLFNREVLSRVDCSVIGRIVDVLFQENCKKIAYFVCSCNGASFAISPNVIYCGKDVAVIRDKTVCISVADLDVTAYRSVISKRVFTTKGDFIGKAANVEYDDRGRVLNIVLDTDECILPSQLYAIGDVILLKDGRNLGKKADFTATLAIADSNDAKVELQEERTPPRVIADYNFLLGRLVYKDVYSYAGQPIASVGSYVTIETVEKARAFGKLLELTLNSN